MMAACGEDSRLQAEVRADRLFDEDQIRSSGHLDHCPSFSLQRISSVEVLIPLIWRHPVVISVILDGKPVLGIAEVRVVDAVGERTVHSRMDDWFGKADPSQPQTQEGFHRGIDVLAYEVERLGDAPSVAQVWAIDASSKVAEAAQRPASPAPDDGIAEFDEIVRLQNRSQVDEHIGSGDHVQSVPLDGSDRIQSRELDRRLSSLPGSHRYGELDDDPAIEYLSLLQIARKRQPEDPRGSQPAA
ncbi:hypothetical protein [Brevibacterium sp.]|uniref:hypothetical protein n=1 Tax=Brevibacterium sp. TaxID=1701 RepID=UPI002810A39F|nr:hypothetical protein [Brevibacterium sp.]